MTEEWKIKDTEWNMFEQQFPNIKKTDVIEVDNVLKHMCKLFVHKNDLQKWNQKIKNNFKSEDSKIAVYHFSYNFHSKCYDKLNQMNL